MKNFGKNFIAAAFAVIASILIGTIKDYLNQPVKSYQLPIVNQQPPIDMLDGKWIEHEGGNWVWEAVFSYNNGEHINNEKVRIEFQFPNQQGPYGIQYSKHGIFENGYIILQSGTFKYANGQEVKDKYERQEVAIVAKRYLQAFNYLYEYANANK